MIPVNCNVCIAFTEHMYFACTYSKPVQHHDGTQKVTRG